MNRDEGFSYILFYVYKGFCVCIFVDFFMKETEEKEWDGDGKGGDEVDVWIHRKKILCL